MSGLQTCFSCGEAFADTRTHCTGCGRRVPRVDPEAVAWLHRPATSRALGLGDLRAQAGLETLQAAVSAESAFLWTAPPRRMPACMYRQRIDRPDGAVAFIEWAGADFAAPSTVDVGGAAYGR